MDAGQLRLWVGAVGSLRAFALRMLQHCYNTIHSLPSGASGLTPKALHKGKLKLHKQRAEGNVLVRLGCRLDRVRLTVAERPNHQSPMSPKYVRTGRTSGAQYCFVWVANAIRSWPTCRAWCSP